MASKTIESMESVPIIELIGASADPAESLKNSRDYIDLVIVLQKKLEGQNAVQRLRRSFGKPDYCSVENRCYHVWHDSKERWRVFATNDEYGVDFEVSVKFKATPKELLAIYKDFVYSV